MIKRFWEEVLVEDGDAGHAVLLDGRGIRTPMQKPLVLPGAEMARAVAHEWEAVEKKVDPAAMPVTGLANAAIDRVAADRGAFVDAIAAYGETDFFCYRAQSPAELAARQEAVWGRWVSWAEARYDLSLHIVEGIIHQPQPGETLLRLKAAAEVLNDFQLAAASRLTHLSGSLVATLALAEGQADIDDLWDDLMLDEHWQEEQWGADETALKNRADRAREFAVAARFMGLAKGQ